MDMLENKDILNNTPNLKEMPYSIPEGYFESVKANLKNRNQQYGSLWDRVTPILGMAAMFLVILTVGNIFMKKSTIEDSFTVEDYIVHSDMQACTEAYNLYNSQIADAAITNEDIIEYLIYIGEDVATINEDVDKYPQINRRY